MIHPSATIHSHALIEKNVKIGANTRIWAFTHILPGVEIGSGCNICDHTFIETGVKLGNNVTVKSGVYLWTGIFIEDDVFIGPCVAFTNDKYPRSRQYLAEYPETRLMQGCSIGANATLLPGITVGAWSMIGAGSVVTKSIPAHAKVYGNPAKIQGWVCRCGADMKDPECQINCLCGREYQFNESKTELSEQLT